MKTAIVRAKVEPELKEEAEAILKTLGLSTGRAITLLLHQIVLTRGLPFELYIPSERVEESIRAARAGHDGEDAGSAEQMAAAEVIMDENRNVLSALARR